MRREVTKKLQTEEIKILSKVHDFCKKNGLTYYLSGGTLLGAVRHQGFIPWDDDIDIVMPRKDYDFFIKNVQEFLGDDYFLQTVITDKHYGRSFAKIRKNNTIFLEEVDKHVEGRHHGIFIDVFPLDSCKKNWSKYVKFKWKISSAIDSYITVKRGGLKTSKKHFFFRLFPIKILYKIMQKLRKGKGDYYYFSFSGILDKSWFEPAIELPFDGEKFVAPKHYDIILTQTYGDYMQIPPVEKQITHNPVRLSFDLNGPDEIMD